MYCFTGFKFDEAEKNQVNEAKKMQKWVRYRTSILKHVLMKVAPFPTVVLMAIDNAKCYTMPGNMAKAYSLRVLPTKLQFVVKI